MGETLMGGAILLAFIAYLTWPWPFKKAQKQTCWVYCPKCNAELTDGRHAYTDTDLVRYTCADCGHKSGWDFDAPAPILVEGKTSEEAAAGNVA